MAKRRRSIPQAPFLPPEGSRVRLDFIGGVWRRSASIVPTAGCPTCGEAWEGAIAARSARKHTDETGHVTWSSTGRLAIHERSDRADATPPPTER